MKNNKLTVIVPCFNESKTILSLIESVLMAPYSNIEIIVVDDFSGDGTREILKSDVELLERVKVLYHPKNMGKGAAIRTGVKQATGDFIVVQDADLEYDPREFPRLLAPLLSNNADVVYGSRFLGSDAHRVLYFYHRIGNGFLTLLSNIFTNLNLTDMETCYKVFRSEIIKSITIQEDRFGFEPEITAKIAKLNCRIYEVGISYYGRTYQEGKKIGWRDGFRAIYCIIRYNLFK